MVTPASKTQNPVIAAIMKLCSILSMVAPPSSLNTNTQGHLPSLTIVQVAIDCGAYRVNNFTQTDTAPLASRMACFGPNRPVTFSDWETPRQLRVV
jgi:hypothetical protein